MDAVSHDHVDDAVMLASAYPPDDDDDEPEVTSSTRLIDDADRRSPTIVRRRMTVVHRSSVPCRDPPTTPPLPTVSTETTHDEQSCCCCCCCNCDVARTPPVCHCRCPATRRFYFPSIACRSDDDDDDNELADNDDESACSCCQCDTDFTPPHTANQLVPVAATRLSSMTAMSLLSGRALKHVNTGAAIARSPTVVVSSSSPTSGLTSGGLASFFAFLRSGSKLWSSAGGAGSVASDIEWRRRQGQGHGRGSSALPPCTCGLGSHLNAPLGVAQQVPDTSLLPWPG